MAAEDRIFLEDFQNYMRSDLLLESAKLQEQQKGRTEKSENGTSSEEKKIAVQEYEKNGLLITEVRIETEEQSRNLGRKPGRYLTIYAEELKQDDGGIHEDTAEEIANWIIKLLPKKAKMVLVAGLGNAEAVPDALGPDTVKMIQVNRMQVNRMQVCAIAPGVMAQTGLETAEILQGICQFAKPDAIVVVDALAARSVTRLGTTIQLTDTGIFPGSGIGNNRQEISKETMGIPVLAVGIPMVVEAAAIIYETIDAIRKVLKQKSNDSEGDFLNQLSKEEQYALFRELLAKKAQPLYVTVKDVDEIEKRWSITLAEALNRAFAQL